MTNTDKQVQPGSNSPDPSAEPPRDPLAAAEPGPQEREYEKSGCYPAEGKPFRMRALFGWLTLLIAALAGVAALLNILLLGNR